MKILTNDQLDYHQLKNQRNGELYSLSALVSEKFESKQLFIHYDKISPSHRASGAHRHSVIEEVVYVTKGLATIAFGNHETSASEGTFIFFDPNDFQTHFLINKTNRDVEIITFSILSHFDLVIFEDSSEVVNKTPSFHFDQNLRDIPDDITEWELFFDKLKEKLKNESHESRRLELLENLGMTARTLIKLDQAESYLLKAVSLSSTYPLHGRLVQNLIRLAHVYQWKKEFEKSQLLFDQARSIIIDRPVSDMLTAAFHQHLGKHFFDQGLFEKAQSEFGLALSIRLKISAPKDQLESSRGSLTETHRRWGRIFSFNLYIRKAALFDAEAIHLAHMKSIQQICSKDHSEKEILAWGNRPYREDQRISAIKNDLVWVIDAQGSVEGYSHVRIFEKDGLKRAHIFGLYLTAAVIGKSLGKTLIDLIMAEIRSANVKMVTLESTITAQKFYRKAGFVNDGPETTVDIGGTPIRCYPMKMDIM